MNNDQNFYRIPDYIIELADEFNLPVIETIQVIVDVAFEYSEDQLYDKLEKTKKDFN